MNSLSALTLLLLTLVSYDLMAQDAYIYDKDRGLWSRTGPSKEYRVAKKYPPGTKLEILDTPSENGFSQVMDKNGYKSWILSNYLQPAANVNLDQALVDLESQKKRYLEEVNRLQAELSARAPLEKTNEALQEKIAKMQVELEQLEQSNEVISSRFNREVFFAGGLTIICGILFGWLFGSRNKKRNSAWS